MCLKGPKRQHHAAMNVKVLSDPNSNCVTKRTEGCSSYEDHCYIKVGLVVEDCKRPREGKKTSFGKGCPRTSISNSQDSSLEVW